MPNLVLWQTSLSLKLYFYITSSSKAWFKLSVQVVSFGGPEFLMAGAPYRASCLQQRNLACERY